MLFVLGNRRRSGNGVDTVALETDGRQLHLVWVGDCPNESDARRLAGSLQKKYNANTTLVKELR